MLTLSHRLRLQRNKTFLPAFYPKKWPVRPHSAARNAYLISAHNEERLPWCGDFRQIESSRRPLAHSAHTVGLWNAITLDATSKWWEPAYHVSVLTSATEGNHHWCRAQTQTSTAEGGNGRGRRGGFAFFALRRRFEMIKRGEAGDVLVRGRLPVLYSQHV